MQHQKSKSKKILIYFFLLLVVGSINNIEFWSEYTEFTLLYLSLLDRERTEIDCYLYIFLIMYVWCVSNTEVGWAGSCRVINITDWKLMNIVSYCSICTHSYSICDKYWHTCIHTHTHTHKYFTSRLTPFVETSSSYTRSCNGIDR